MAQRIKLGLVGVQKWGKHVGVQMAASEVVELAWVYDLDRQAAANAGACWNARVASTLEELLASDVAGIVVITPNHTHLPIGLAAAAGGKHAMIVKPLVNTMAEGRQLLDAFDRAGVFLATNHPARKEPISLHVKQLLDSAQLGKVVLVTNVTGHGGGMRKQPDDWRARRATAPGGPLIQLTVHTFDTWQYWFGPIIEVQAAGGHRATPGDNDDFFAGQARFADGLLANFATQYAAPGAGFHAIYGTSRTIVLDHDHAVEHLLIDRPNTWPDSQKASIALEPYSGIRRDVEDFARDIAAGRQPHASGADGLRAVACVHAAIRSRDAGGAWINVDEVLAGD